MTQSVRIENTDLEEFLSPGNPFPERYCRALEEGKILFFPKMPFDFPKEEIEFLLQQKQVGAHYHKNIAYRPLEHRVTGASKSSSADRARLVEIMSAYSQRATRLLSLILPVYAEKWRLDYASFRPQEERGRNLKFKARNDLLHVDAFPTRPTNGDRIFRFFTNINPEQPRQWITSDFFPQILKQESVASLPLPAREESLLKRSLRRIAETGASIGLPLPRRSRYDEFMLRLHDYLKESPAFQQDCRKSEWDFPPFSCWAVFTDSVPHAALSGQFALEQTFIVPRDAMVLPDLAPVNVLERLCGFPLTL